VTPRLIGVYPSKSSNILRVTLSSLEPDPHITSVIITPGLSFVLCSARWFRQHLQSKLTAKVSLEEFVKRKSFLISIVFFCLAAIAAADSVDTRLLNSTQVLAW